MASRPVLPPLIAAVLLAGGCASAGLPSPPAARRPVPQLLSMGCSPNCVRTDWIAFLARKQLNDLAPPSGGRAYRMIWTEADEALAGKRRVGFIQVVLGADGSGRLSSCWSDDAVGVTAAEIGPFENALAKSVFSAMPGQDAQASEDPGNPREHLLEAVAPDGGYHFVHRVGGIKEDDVYEAAYMLEELARARQFRKPPADDLCH